ncbi:hypothetical protein GCM10023347_19550 [Streptomyces chumphonensis]
MIGRLATGRSGLGMLAVMGRRRVPSPPAITTAFMSVASSFKRRRSHRPSPDGVPDFRGEACLRDGVEGAAQPVATSAVRMRRTWTT